MGGLFSSPAPPPAPPPPPPTPAPAPTVSDESAQEAAAAERKRRSLAQGRASTVLTSGEGDTSEANTASAQLLGQ